MLNISKKHMGHWGQDKGVHVAAGNATLRPFKLKNINRSETNCSFSGATTGGGQPPSYSHSTEGALP